MRYQEPGALRVGPDRRLTFAGAKTTRDGPIRAQLFDGRMLFNVTPVYDLNGDAFAVGIAIDPAGQAGGVGFGGVAVVPGGDVLALASITGQMAGNHLVYTELEGLRLLMRNAGTGVGELSVMRGAILHTSLAGSGHNRSLYARADAEPGATGFINAGVFAVTSVDTLLDARAIQVSSEGVPGKNVGIYLDATVPYGTGIVIGPSVHAHVQNRTANGPIASTGPREETLSLTGPTNDTLAEVLPADSIIRAVVVSAPGTYAVGDPLTPERFLSYGTGPRVGLRHHASGRAAQEAAGRVRVSVQGPASGVAKVTVFYERFVPE